MARERALARALAPVSPVGTWNVMSTVSVSVVMVLGPPWAR